MAGSRTGRGNRPTGITILAILEMLGGILSILSGLAFATLGGTLSGLLGSGILGPISGIFGGVAIVAGLIYLAIGYGFFKGMSWSWWAGIILYVLGLIGSLLSILTVVAILPLAIYILLVYYMTRPGVKGWFGV